MLIVIDASVALAWLLQEEGQADAATAIIDCLPRESGIVPGIFWYEVRHILVKKERLGDINHEDAQDFMSRLSGLSIEYDHKHNEEKTVSLARRHKLSVYDAAYLETAIRHRGQIATFDKALAEAACKERVENAVPDILA